MNAWIEEYLKDHESAWARTTLLSEKARLMKVAHLLGGTPAEIHKSLQSARKKPYTIKTTFIRLVAMETWALETGRSTSTEFRLYMKKHRNKFKHAYQKEEIRITEQEARERLSKLTGPARDMAVGMLNSGVRLSEVYTLKDDVVIGKGGKPRKIFARIESVAPRSELCRQLKAVGLKSHTLRKLCATKMVDNGASAADLCKVFGWSSIQTAYQYLQAKDDERLQALMAKGKEG